MAIIIKPTDINSLRIEKRLTVNSRIKYKRSCINGHSYKPAIALLLTHYY